ncbi:MAG: DUF4830 domain-containing protein [Clostridia bacterium]|nr:DUF4830 domain-containing protein [Clostridia bacterium]
MFVISMNAQKRRLIPTVLCLALIAAMLIAALCYPAERTMVTSANAVSGQNDEACATFLTSLGYTAELPAVQIKEIRLPDVFDDALTAYNDVQKQAGYDLSAYAGQRVKLRTYALAEHPDGHACEAHIYVYNGLIIGGDIAAVDGTFTDPLCAVSSRSC